MKALAGGLCIAVCRLDFRVLQGVVQCGGGQQLLVQIDGFVCVHGVSFTFSLYVSIRCGNLMWRRGAEDDGGGKHP